MRVRSPVHPIIGISMQEFEMEQLKPDPNVVGKDAVSFEVVFNAFRFAPCVT